MDETDYGLLYLFCQKFFLSSMNSKPRGSRTDLAFLHLHLKDFLKLSLSESYVNRTKACTFKSITNRFYAAVTYHMFDIQNHNFLNFSLRLFDTTLMLLNAIAALATMGLRRNPQTGYNAPAAIGMPTTL